MGQAVDEAGNIWEVDAQGNPVAFVGKQEQQAQQAPRSVTVGTPRAPEPAKPQTMKLDDGSVVQIFPDGTTRTVVQGTPKTGGTNPKGGTTAKIRDDALQAYNDAIALRRVASDLRDRNTTGAGATTGLAGVQDFFPTEGNSSFNTAAQRARGYVKRSLGFTGGEGNTVAESSTLYDPYLPSTSDWDGKILDKIAALEQLADDAERKSIATLGGVPDQYGNITQPNEQQTQPSAPVPQQRDDMAVAGTGPDRSNRADVLFGQPPSDSQNGGFVPYGAETRLERNPQWKGVNEAVKGMIVAGRSPEEIKGFLNSKGIAGDAASGVNEAINYYRKTGKSDFGVDVENIQVPMSGFDQFRNNAPQTMVGTAAATALNAGGLGIPQMLAGGEGLDYLRSQNPGSAFAGDVAGVVGGTAALGKAGGAVAGRLAPSLLGGGGKAAAGRQLATDAAYGGIYGATTEGTPQGALTGALTAGLGSAGGQAIGTGIGKALKGASMSAPAQALRDMGVNNLTIGQMLGGKAKSLEDAMTSAPLIGDIVNARRGEGFQDFNLAALNQAGAPIGATVNETGENGLNQLMGQVSGAYDNATAGVNAPLDAQFMADMQAASAAGQRLPPDYQVRFDKMGQNRIGPIVDAGSMTGDAYQQSMRGLKGARSSASQAAPGFEQDYRDAITLSMDALKGQMQRGGGQSVIDGLAAADNSNRLGKTIEKAMGAARNGTRSGEIQVFTPSQLNDAAYAAQRKFPGPRPFSQLADAGQEVLPSQLPDSGTARRLTSLALPASLGGVGGGLGFTGGDPQTAMQGAGAGLTVGTLLALGGSKAGQKALEAALFKRPKAVRRAGGIFGSRKGQQALSGLVTAPLLIE